MEPVELTEADLLLRPWRPSDADAVYRACQDPEIERWTLLPSPYRRENAEELVTERSPKGWAEDTSAPFGVFDRATGELLGSNGLIRLDREAGEAEIGYWVAPWARRRGVAAKSSRAVARWAFDVLGVRRLVWSAAPGNHVSRLIAERLGFQFEGTLRMGFVRPDGTRGDTWVASLLPGELKEEPPAASAATRAAARRAATFFAPQPVLHGEAAGGPVTLRRATESDLDAMVATCRDPEAVRWTTVPDPYERSSAEFFLRAMAERWAAGTAGIFGLYDAAGAYCGSFDLRLMAADPLVADVGYLVSPWARGKGYATAALRALCEWGFGHLDLARIEWRAHVGNQASRRVAEKAGFVIEGVERAGIPHRGERRDCWVGSLLPSDLTRTRSTSRS